MNERGPRKGPPENRSGGRLSEGSRATGRDASWREVDAKLEVLSRLVVIADSIECGDVRMAEDCVLQLIDDLDVAELLLKRERHVA
jgi:hypothetical protein